jgi:hypothetical protein
MGVVDEGPAGSVDVAFPSGGAGPDRAAFTALTHPEMLAATGSAQALFSQWSRQKRRVALRGRDADEFPLDSVPDVQLWQDSL